MKRAMRQYTRALFIDFDGVINSESHFDRMREKYGKEYLDVHKNIYLNTDFYGDLVTKTLMQKFFIDYENVKKLARILRSCKANTHIVVHSSWTHRWDLEFIKDIWEPYKDFLFTDTWEITPKQISSDKVHEIGFWLHDRLGDRWLKKLDDKEFKVLIIDDEYCWHQDRNHEVYVVDAKTGLVEVDAEKIVKYLCEE